MSKRNTKIVPGVVEGDPADVSMKVEVVYAELFPPDTPLLPGEMTLAQFAKKYKRGANRMAKELDVLVKAGKMATHEDVYIRGQPYKTYYLIQRNDNNKNVIIKKGRK